MRRDIVNNIYEGKTKYVIEALTEHAEGEDGETLYKVHWSGFPKEDATREPISVPPRSKLLQYHRRKKLPLRAQIDSALQA